MTFVRHFYLTPKSPLVHPKSLTPELHVNAGEYVAWLFTFVMLWHIHCGFVFFIELNSPMSCKWAMISFPPLWISSTNLQQVYQITLCPRLSKPSGKNLPHHCSQNYRGLNKTCTVSFASIGLFAFITGTVGDHFCLSISSIVVIWMSWTPKRVQFW